MSQVKHHPSEGQRWWLKVETITSTFLIHLLLFPLVIDTAYYGAKFFCSQIIHFSYSSHLIYQIVDCITVPVTSVETTVCNKVVPLDVQK